MTRARILLADDHKEIRDRAVHLLESEFNVIGAFEDGQSFLSAELTMKPDVCVVDISMAKPCGIEAATRLKGRGSKAKIVFLTVHDDPDFLEAALNTGALGYVVKARMASDLRVAVRAVLAGQQFVSPALKLQAGGRKD